MKRAYPCLISYSAEEKCYYVTFPDLECAFTDAETLEEAIENADDVLNLMLMDYEADHHGEKPPVPSDIKKMTAKENEILSLILCDTERYKQELALMKKKTA